MVRVHFITGIIVRIHASNQESCAYDLAAQVDAGIRLEIADRLDHDAGNYDEREYDHREAKPQPRLTQVILPIM